MNIFAGLGEVNYLAVLVATIAAFIIGAIWYSPVLFAKQWMKAEGLSDEKIKKGNMGMIMGGSFVASFVTAVALALLFGGAGLTSGIQMGLLIGIAFVATTSATHYLFSHKSITYFLITAGHDVLHFLVMAMIISVW